MKIKLNCSTHYLQLFLYLLARDEVPFGVIERIMTEIEKVGADGEVQYSEQMQADYALYLANRLLWQRK